MGVKISELAEANTLEDNDVFPIVQSGETKKIPYGTIVETGSNANGNYIKYANGTMICYNNISQTVNITSSYEGEYYVGTGTINYPVSFVAVPTVTVTLAQNSALLRFNFTSLYADRFNGYISKLQSKSNVNVIIQYIAIGRWK